MDWTTIISGFLSFIAGGGIVTIFTLRQTKEGKQLDNAVILVNEYKSLLENYKNEAENAKAEVDSLREEFADIKKEMAELRAKLTAAQTAWRSAEMFRCDKINCAHRIPPLDKEKVKEFISEED